MLGLFGREIREDDFEIPAELPQNLAAGAARRRQRRGVGDDRDAGEGAMALGNRLEHRDSLGADGQAIRGVFDVAARDDRAVGRFEGSADFEVRKSRVGVLSRATGRRDKVAVARSSPQTPRPEPPVVAASVAFLPAHIRDAALEPASPIGLDPCAAIVQQQPQRIGAAHAVDDVCHTGDLIEPRGQRLNIRIRVTGFSRRGARPVAHRIETVRRRLVADDVRPAVLLPGHDGGELARYRQKRVLLAFSHFNHRDRETTFMRAGQ